LCWLVLSFHLLHGCAAVLLCCCAAVVRGGRWTDKLNGLLRTARLHLQARLVRLDLGCVKIYQDPATTLMEPLAALTALSDLRMSLYSNQDTPLTLQLDQLTALSNLQVGCMFAQRALPGERAGCPA
jgi:hypothetical protein